jgi:purine-binding chemotaxis protein CheW
MSDLAVAGLSSLTAGDEEQLVTMTVDGQLFGIPILSVQDIVEPRQITPVPLASSAVAGVLNLRGRIVTVIDLRVCLGAEPTNLDERPMSVTVEHKHDLYTILVDGIGDVRSLPRRDLDRPPQTLDPKMRRLCSGVFRLKEDLLAVLDVEKVLDPATIAEAPKRAPLKRRRAAVAETAGTKPASRKKPDATATKGEGGDDAKPAEPKTRAASAAKPAAGSREKAAPAKSTASEDRSLFERLGGEAAISGAVDLLYQKLMADARLTPFFDGIDMGHQKSQMIAFLAQAFGGPAQYHGPGLRQAHQRLVHQMEMDDGHFIAVAGHLADTLNQMGVPAELIEEVMTAVEGVRDEVMDR